MQRKELTGFFKLLEEPQAVKNLVPFELHRGDKFEHPEDMVSRHFGPCETLLKKTTLKFENFSRPQGEIQNEVYKKYEKQKVDFQIEAKELHLFSGPLIDEEKPHPIDDACLKWIGMMTH
jgi:hypothetical protein